MMSLGLRKPMKFIPSFLPSFLEGGFPDDNFICSFLNTVDATALRATCREVGGIIARYRWCDIKCRGPSWGRNNYPENGLVNPPRRDT